MDDPIVRERGRLHPRFRRRLAQVDGIGRRAQDLADGAQLFGRVGQRRQLAHGPDVGEPVAKVAGRGSGALAASALAIGRIGPLEHGIADAEERPRGHAAAGELAQGAERRDRWQHAQGVAADEPRRVPQRLGRRRASRRRRLGDEHLEGQAREGPGRHHDQMLLAREHLGDRTQHAPVEGMRALEIEALDDARTAARLRPPRPAGPADRARRAAPTPPWPAPRCRHRSGPSPCARASPPTRSSWRSRPGWQPAPHRA